MRFSEDVLSKLYLGIAPTTKSQIRRETVVVRLLSSNEIIQLDNRSYELFPDDENPRIMLLGMLIAYNCTHYKNDVSFEDFCDMFDHNDIVNVINAHEKLLENSPKIELISEEDLEDICEFMKSASMQRYKWELCKKFNMPPNVLFCNGGAITDEQILWCFVNEKIDTADKLDHWCDECKEKMTDENRCWNCGNPIVKHEGGSSSTFDEESWYRRAYGTWDENTNSYVVPKGSYYDKENKCWVTVNETKQEKQYEESVAQCIGEDEKFKSNEIEDEEQYIEEEFEPDDWEDFLDDESEFDDSDDDEDEE